MYIYISKLKNLNFESKALTRKKSEDIWGEKKGKII